MNVFIVEKQTVAVALVNAGVAQPNDILISIHSFGLWVPQRHRIRLSSIPFTEDVNLCRRALNTECYPTFYWQGNELNIRRGKSHITRIRSLYDRIGRKQAKIEGVYAVASTDRTGAYAVKSFLNMFTDRVELPELKWLNVFSYMPEHLKEVWAQRKIIEYSCIETMYQEQKIKREFDTLWRINASAVLGELQHSLGYDADKVLSKYELMTLNIIRTEAEKGGRDNLLDKMESWTGTGAYPPSMEVQVGSMNSRHEIMKRLLSMGYIERTADTIKLSDTGMQLSRFFHEKTYDPDLPFRLLDWMKEGDRKAMKRYIRTIFGRQLRYQRKRFRELNIGVKGKEKPAPFYFPVAGMSENQEKALIAMIPFDPEKSQYWSPEKPFTMIGCANTYIFTCDSEQGDSFKKLLPHQVHRWVNEDRVAEKNSPEDLEDQKRFDNL